MVGKCHRLLERLFGVLPEGFLDLPVKMSGVRLSRCVWSNLACTRCFPRGDEARMGCGRQTRRRSWKYSRRTRYHRARVARPVPCTVGEQTGLLGDSKKQAAAFGGAT